MSQTTTPQVSLATILFDIAEEVNNYVAGPNDREADPATGQENFVADLSDNAEVKALFGLKNRYEEEDQRNQLTFAILGKDAISDPARAIFANFKRNLYRALFWHTLRNAAGLEAADLVVIREGWKVGTMNREDVIAKHQNEKPNLLDALRQGGQNGLVN